MRLPALAQSCDPLLIVGEPGVGKALLAAHIHAKSPFAHNKLITVDCSLLSDRDQLHLLFSDEIPVRRSPLETGATIVVKNPLAACNGFKDMLAHALKTNEVWSYRRNRYVRVAAHMILASSIPFSQRHAASDVDRRLIVACSRCETILLPPLRKRENDILLLAKYFFQKEKGSRSSRSVPFANNGLNSRHRQLILARNWSGNILELKTYVRRLFRQSPKELLRQNDFQALEEAHTSIEERRGFDLRSTLVQIEHHLIALTLRVNNQNKLAAARLLGVSRRTVHRNSRYT
ncbi:MAG: sigma 54-interacting transcriptional regulator [Ignavibacteriae bacterium]|nr:sigma 54-interacting transcriptional regulator [Ignavibacteriota bacterium]